MGQATATPSISLTISEAAAEIISLINGRPHSPRQDEIEAIIVRVVPTAADSMLSLYWRPRSPMTKDTSATDRDLISLGATFDELAAKWAKLVDAQDEPDDATEELGTRVVAIAEQILALPTVSFAGVQVKARVCLHFESDALDAVPNCIERAARASLLRDLLKAA